MKVLGVIGILAIWLSLLAPVHELGHVIAAAISGIPFRMYWKVTWVQTETWPIAMAGYPFEFAIWAVLYMIRHEKGKGDFFKGALIGTATLALISGDHFWLADNTRLSLFTINVLWLCYVGFWYYLIRKHHETILKMRRAYGRTTMAPGSGRRHGRLAGQSKA